ncbi:MAG: hypothetical protein ACR2NP_07150 [Pirellulaceae bacterium]
MVKILIVVGSLVGVSFVSTGYLPETRQPGAEEDSSASTIFDERIMPIFRSPDPSSCVQCHLSAVDLKNYILPSHEKTFLSLRDQGLIDLEEPGNSKILTLIAMGDRDMDEGARMIHVDMRKAEFEAFSSWIAACCEDETLRTLPPLESSELARPPRPDAVIRHARKSRLVDSFTRNVWSQRMRCFPCHTPHEIGRRQTGPQQKFDEWKEQYGERMIIFQETPEATLDHLIQRSQQATDGELPLINLDDPANSLIVLKPTAKLPPRVDGEFQPPSSADPVSHMGGLKMHLNDQSYKSFLAWLEDYARVVGDQYTTVEDLPADNWHATQRILRMKETPEEWGVGTVVQMFVFARNADDSAWTDQPVAFTQGTITPRHIINGALFLLSPEDDEKAAEWRSAQNRLPRGRYLIKVFVDSSDLIAKDPARMLAAEDYAGAVEIVDAKWRPKFPKAEWISAAEITK